ncbi:MAG: hypothetical protein DRP59_04485 [Spirochaetes bacterium]|nr:MAG: hypothetical protein DRP59_04485 [Spirochaetota bacterium]
MDLYKLKSFYTVAKMGSFSRAAEALYLTQPAVSTQIKDLESEYKTKLFDRIGRNIRLTQSGEMLIPFVKNILDLVDESHLAVNVLKKAGEGSVKVGVSELPGARLIPDCLSRFLEQYPKVSISVTAKKSALITDLVKTNKVDLGIVGNSLPEISENDFKGETVHKDNIVVAVSNSHPLAQKNSVTVKELSNLPLIVSLKNTVSRQAIDKLFHRLNIPYTIAYEIDNKSMIKTMIEKNLGIAFFSYLEIKKEAESGWIKTLPISDYPFYRYIQIIYHKNKELSPSQKAFYDFFVEEKDCPDGQPL